MPLPPLIHLDNWPSVGGVVFGNVRRCGLTEEGTSLMEEDGRALSVFSLYPVSMLAVDAVTSVS